MPDRPGLDDDARLQALIDVWRSGQADVEARLASVWADVKAALGSGDANRIERLGLQARRLQELSATAQHIADDLAQQTSTWLASGGMDRAYRAGAMSTLPSFIFTLPHTAAVEVLSRDTFADVLAATRFVDDDAKRFVRRVGRQLTAAKLVGEETAQQAGRRLRGELSRDFERRGLGAVTYRDGSRHGFGEYAEMLLRTKTGVAYNAGTLNTAGLLGIGVVEILDGSLCGLTSHADSQLANGMLVPVQFAQDWPLSHPNCRRAFAPRPDISPADIGEPFVSVVSPEARADQTAFEAALRAQAQGARPRARQAKQAKAGGKGRAPKAGSGARTPKRPKGVQRSGPPR